MSTKLHQIFKNINELQPTTKLENLILWRIEKEKNRIIQRKLFWSRFGLAVSGLLAAYSLYVLGPAFLRSEFMSLVQLLVSDAVMVWAHWQEFLYSLLETLPVFSLIGLLLPVAILCWILSVNVRLSHSKIHHRQFV